MLTREQSAKVENWRSRGFHLFELTNLKCAQLIENELTGMDSAHQKQLLGKKTGTGDTVLHYAVRNEDVKTLKMLLKFPVNVNENNNLHRTSLHLAAADGNLEMIAVLLAAGANPALTDFQYNRAIHIAASCHHLDVVKILYAKDPESISIRGHNGKLPVEFVDKQTGSDLILFFKSVQPDARVIAHQDGVSPGKK